MIFNAVNAAADEANIAATPKATAAVWNSKPVHNPRITRMPAVRLFIADCVNTKIATSPSTDFLPTEGRHEASLSGSNSTRRCSDPTTFLSSRSKTDDAGENWSSNCYSIMISRVGRWSTDGLQFGRKFGLDSYEKRVGLQD